MEMIGMEELLIIGVCRVEWLFEKKKRASHFPPARFSVRFMGLLSVFLLKIRAGDFSPARQTGHQ
jgi:hypothetical protein